MAKNQDSNSIVPLRKGGKPLKFNFSSVRGIMSLKPRNAGSSSLVEQKQHKASTSKPKYLKAGVHGENWRVKHKPTPNKGLRQGIYLSGPKKVDPDNRIKFVKGIDKLYEDQVKKFGKENVNIYYGDWNRSESDSIIRNYANKRGIGLFPISQEKGWKGMGDEDAFRKMTWLQKGEHKEKTLTKWEQEDKSVRRFSLSNKGEIQYSGADRSYWWNRWKDLTEKFGKGKTRQITQAYLDEIEDIGKGTSLQNPTKSSIVSRKGIKTSTLPQLDQGAGTTSVKKANPRSMLAGLELLEDKNKWGTQDLISKAEARGEDPKQVKEWLHPGAKTRLAGLRGDEGVFLGMDERVDTDYVDSITEAGTQHVVGDSQDMSSQQRRLTDALPYNEKTAKSKWTNQLTRTKDPRVNKIISDLINNQIENQVEFGYTGQNVSATENAFGDFAKQLEGKSADQDVQDSQPKANKEFTEREGVRFVESDQVQNERRTNISWKKELLGLKRLIRQQEDAGTTSVAKAPLSSGTLLTGIKAIGDVTAKDLQSSLGAPFTTKKESPDGSIKEKGSYKHEIKWKPKTQEQIRLELPENISRTTNKVLKPNIGKWNWVEGKFTPNRIPTNYDDSPGKAAYLKQRTLKRTVDVLANTDKYLTEAKGNLSRAYVSDPSKASTGDIRKELTKSSAPNKKVLPKGISGIIKSKQAEYKPNVDSSQPTKAKVRGKVYVSDNSQPNIIKMTKSKVSGKWGTPSEHRKSALKILGKGVSRKLPTTLGALSALSIFTGAIRGRREARADLGREPNILESMEYTFLSKEAREQTPWGKWRKNMRDMGIHEVQ